jgi:iron(III) transport system substrate-binding protein
VGGLLLAGCAPAASPQSAQPPGEPAKGATVDQADPWQETLAAARREGRVVILAPAGADRREALGVGFQKRHPEISLEMINASGGEHAQRVLTERAAGQYLPDLIVIGSQSIYFNFLPANALDPLQPYLVGPDIQPENWRDGHLWFSDKAGQYNLVNLRYKNTPFHYNTNLVPVDEIKSWKDLLQPRWRGKMAMFDPTIPGSALDVAAFWLTTPGLGEQYVRRLLSEQEVIVSRNQRQLADWSADGRYPIGLGSAGSEVRELIRAGVPLGHFDPERLEEGGFVTAGGGTVSVFNRAPHPNAAKVYLNWHLSREGQTDWAIGSAAPSLRTDVGTDFLPQDSIPLPNLNYRETYGEDYVRMKETQVLPLLRQMIASR